MQFAIDIRTDIVGGAQQFSNLLPGHDNPGDLQIT